MKDLLIKYLNETISEAEKIQLLDWLKAPKNQKTFKEFVKIDLRLRKEFSHLDDEGVYEKILRRLDKPHFAPRTRGLGRKIIPCWLKYAAVIVGVALVGYGIYLKSPQNNTEDSTSQVTLYLHDGTIQIIDEQGHAEFVDARGEKISEQINNELIYFKNDSKEKLIYNTLSVPFGKTFKLILADGSRVVLNAGSELRFPVNFITDHDREVYLQGEAYFEVAEDFSRQFVVNTEKMAIKVLGTHFVVSSYAEDKIDYTVLLQGSVLAQNKAASADSQILSPNEKATLENGNLALETVNVRKYVSWVQGRLIFINDPFNVMVNKLERKYNVKIVNHYPELHDISITATFTNESIEEVLKTFQTYKYFDWTLKDRTVNIYKPKL